jgi:transcriptional regulator with XRE-family HTH domain
MVSQSDSSPKAQLALKGVREKLDLTQAELAELLGESRAYVAMIESGDRPLKEDIANKIELATGIPAAWLFGNDPLRPLPRSDLERVLGMTWGLRLRLVNGKLRPFRFERSFDTRTAGDDFLNSPEAAKTLQATMPPSEMAQLTVELLRAETFSQWVRRTNSPEQSVPRRNHNKWYRLIEQIERHTERHPPRSISKGRLYWRRRNQLCDRLERLERPPRSRAK